MMHTAPRARRPGRWTLRCSLCGREIPDGEEYWSCNGFTVCDGCLPDFARRELEPFRLRRGEEEGNDFA